MIFEMKKWTSNFETKVIFKIDSKNYHKSFNVGNQFSTQVYKSFRKRNVSTL